MFDINRIRQMQHITTYILMLVICYANAEGYDYQSAFGSIYQNKLWNQNGPLSGPGSNPCTGIKYLINLQHFIDRPEVKKIVEIGFGDWEMMQHILLEHKTYVGYEVVESLRRESKYNKQYQIVKGLQEITESGDLLIVRDVMQHWPTPEIDYFVANILPRFKYALLTNDYSPNPDFPNITPGQYRPINLKNKIKNQQTVLEIDFQTGHPIKSTILYTNPDFPHSP